MTAITISTPIGSSPKDCRRGLLLTHPSPSIPFFPLIFLLQSGVCCYRIHVKLQFPLLTSPSSALFFFQQPAKLPSSAQLTTHAPWHAQFSLSLTLSLHILPGTNPCDSLWWWLWITSKTCRRLLLNKIK